MAEFIKGIIPGERDVWDVVKAVKKALTYFKDDTSTYTFAQGRDSSIAAKYEIDSTFKMVNISFGVEKNKRMLSVMLDCHSDNEDIIKGEKTIFLLGTNDPAKEIILKVLEQFEGDKFLYPGDYSDPEIWIKL